MFVSKSMNECVDVNNGFFLLFSPVVVIRDDSTQRKSSKEGSVWGTIQHRTRMEQIMHGEQAVTYTLINQMLFLW